MPQIINPKIVDSPRKISVSKIALLAGVALLSIVAVSTVVSNVHFVQPYERVVVTRGGNFSAVWDEGTHISTPFISSTKYYDTRTQELVTPKLNTYTTDNQEVDATITIQYNIPSDPASIHSIYEKVGDPSKFITSLVVGQWKIEGGKINVSEVANKRGELTKKVAEAIIPQAKLLYNISITNVQITDLQYQETYRAAQNKASIVKTEIETEQGNKIKAEIVADRAKISAAGEANRVIEEARGASESIRLNAIAQAQSVKIMGEAQASAQELMGKAIAANPLLVQYEQAKRWNGTVPQNIYASVPIPFMNLSGTSK